MPTILSTTVRSPQLIDLIRDDYVQTRFRYELMSSAMQSKGILTCVQDGGQVSNNYLAEIKRTCSFSVAELEDFFDIDFLNDRIKIYCDVYNPTIDSFLTFSLGVFVLSSGSRVAARGIITRDVEGYDLTQVLKRAKHTDRYVIPPFSLIIPEVRKLLDAAGVAHSIDDSGDDGLSVERSWDSGGEYIATINDLLSMVNFNSLSFDENGVAVASKYTPPAERDSEFEYITDDRSIVGFGASQTRDLFDVPNAVLVVVSQPDKPVIQSYRENNNPNSPTSTVNVSGPTRLRVITDNQDLIDQSQADAAAVRYLSESSQVFETVEFQTAIVPTHGTNNIIRLVHTDLEIADNYSETSWTIPLKSGSMMSHSVRKTVNV